MAAECNARIKLLRKVQGDEGVIGEFLIRQEKDPDALPMDIRIASVGNVDSGKSTLLGVLLTGEADDGRGRTRTRVFRHPHELETGRTSSVSIQVIGFDVDGNIVNKDLIKKPSEMELLEKAVKTITFVDLAGHEKYLKTTIFGLLGHVPQAGMLVVAANQGVLQMTKEHLGLLVAINLPFFVVMTKIDLSPTNKTRETEEELKKLLKMPGIYKVPYVIKNQNDVIVAAKNFHGKNVVPIFKVSSVTLEGFDLLTSFLNLLSPVSLIDKNLLKIKANDVFKAHVDDIFNVKGVGTVVSAFVESGQVTPDTNVVIGPLKNGEFRRVRIKSIQYKRMFVDKAIAGQSATFALKGIKHEEVRKGMILHDLSKIPRPASRFVADVFVLYHSTTIRKGYSPVIHCSSIRQAARIIDMDKEFLTTGSKATVTFEFLYNPEAISPGMKLVFREGRTKGIGKIIKILN